MQNHALSTGCGSKDKEGVEMHKHEMHDQFMKLPAVKCYWSMRGKVGRLNERSGQNDESHIMKKIFQINSQRKWGAIEIFKQKSDIISFAPQQINLAPVWRMNWNL